MGGYTMGLRKYGRIYYPRNDERSAGAWRAIGYRVIKDAPAIGYCRVSRYGTEYNVWDSSQVEPIPGNKAQKRREAYHEYLFRRRMWDKRFDVARQFKEFGKDEYEIWLTDFVDDMKLWTLGVLVCRPAKLEHIAAVVVADCRKQERPDSPKERKNSGHDGYAPANNGVDPFADNEYEAPEPEHTLYVDDIPF
jgi:hypothetical protein